MVVSRTPVDPPPSAPPPPAGRMSAPDSVGARTAARVGVRVTAMTSAHAAPVLAIYRHALATGIAALDDTVPTWEQFDARHLPRLRYIARDEHRTVLGWVAAGPAFATAADAPVIEHAIYVHPHAHRRGIGRRLLDTFVGAAAAAGVHRIRTGIFATNTASLALHGRAGFTRIGVEHRRDPDRRRRVLYLMELTPPPPHPSRRTPPRG